MRIIGVPLHTIQNIFTLSPLEIRYYLEHCIQCSKHVQMLRGTVERVLFSCDSMQSPKQIIKRISSYINKELKIVWEDGKKLLNTKNTNYSYGTLVDVLEYGLDIIPLEQVSSILLLGMGGGSIIQSLREKYSCNAPVVAVEIDPVVIDIAYEEFYVDEMENVEVRCMDAWDYIKGSTTKFDLIIIDIFIDIHVPKKFYEPKFWEMIEKNVSNNGFIVFNAGIDLAEKEVQEFTATLPLNFIYQKNYNVMGSNTVIIVQKI